MSLLSSLTEKIAASLGTSLLKASAGVVRKRLSQNDAKKALAAAIASALAEALEGQELRGRAEDWEHYGSLLEAFFTSEEVAFELAHLLDPRPDQVPEFTILAHEFRMAGYVPETMPGFDLDSFLRAFFSAFYAAAGTQEPLRAGINLKLLGTQLQQLGIAVSELRRAAEAGERAVDTPEWIEVAIERFVAGKSEGEDLRGIVEAARAEGFLAAYRTFEDIGSGLLKAGVDLGVDSQGVVEIMLSGSEASRALPSARLEAVRLLASELRSAVLDHRPTEAELNVLEARYRQHIIRWFENLTFQGMMRTPKPIVLPLEEVYVELRVVAEVPEAADAFSVEERRLLLESDEKDETKRRELMSQLDAFRRERWSRTIPERKSMAEALHQRERRAFVILGDPGSGKTTLLHFLALVYARGPETSAQRLGVDLAEADRLPIFVPLAAFDDMLRESQREGRSLTLLEFLPRYYDLHRGLPGLEPLFRRAFHSGRALVLLDGLDEVLDVGTRTYVAQQAGALIGDLAVSGVRFAVSSRFVGYREAPLNLPSLSVLDFGMPEIEAFVRRWAHAFEKWAANGIESPEMLRRAQTLEAGILDDVRSNESVRRLAANPLMLTMLALLRRQVGRLPHRRVQLYESYVGALLENWVDSRSEGARSRSIEILDRHQAENILIPLASWLQNEKPSGTASRAEIRNKLVEIGLRERGIYPAQAERPAVREAEQQAERFFREMRQMAGLIIERGHDAFGFLNLTFQEYFAGRALAQLGDQCWETICPNLHDPRWREPILLCAGRLGVVENRRAQVTQLVRSILEHEDPAEADLHRNLLYALSIACDDVNLEPTLVAELVERAIKQLSTPIPVFARELLRLLGQLVANGMANFEVCRAAVEGVKSRALSLMAIEEWGRFVEVRDIEAWLRRQLDSANGRTVETALVALSFKIEEDPFLQQKAIACLGSFGEGGPSAARVLAGAAESHLEIRQELLKSLASNDWQVRQNALMALSGLVRTDAVVRSAIQEIAEDARSSNRSSAIGVLASLLGVDAEVRRIILESLKDGDQWVLLSAVKALSTILVTDREVLSIVMELLACGRISADLLQVLKVGVTGVPEIRQVFLEKLGAQDWRIRQAACEGLAEAGSASPENLKRVLRSQDSLESLAVFEACASFSAYRSEERWIAVWRSLLSRLAPSARQVALSALSGVVATDVVVRQSVLEQLGDENYVVRQSALSALSGVVGTDEEVRRAVLERLGDAQYVVRQSALSALSGTVGTDEEVRRAVLERLGDAQYVVRQSALSALSGAVGTDEEVRRTVLERLGDAQYVVRQSALSALSGVVGTDEEVRRAVLERLGDAQYWVRQSALSALSGAVGTDEEVRRAVLERLEDEQYGVRQSALSALSGVVGTDEEVRRAVLERLGDAQYWVRQSALSALSGAVGTDEEVRRAVLERLEDEQTEVRQSALSALSEVVGTHEEVRCLVLERLGDNDFRVRQSALSVLSGIVGTDEKVRRVVLERLGDQDFPVRLQVVEVVAKCQEGGLFESLRPRLWDWLGVDCNVSSYGLDTQWVLSVQAQLAKRFGSRLPTDSSLRNELLERLREPRWSSRLGAMLALLAWPGGPPDDVKMRVLAALEDPRGMEAYPAQLTAASFLINRNETAAEAIDLCLEALDYGTQPWEDLDNSHEARKQAALVLRKLQPVFYVPRIYYTLLHVLHNDVAADVRDAAYGTLVNLARISELYMKENRTPPTPPDELVDACLNRDCVLYGGAGLSASVGFPVWQSFVKQLLDWAVKSQKIKPEFAESLQAAIQQGDVDPVADNVVSAVIEGDPKALHAYLRGLFLRDTALSLAHNIIKDIPFSAVLTTNFDNLFEMAYEATESPIFTPRHTENLLDAISKRQFFLLKLYGTLEEPESVLVAPAQYEAAISGNLAYAQFMETLFFSRTLLFVGASLEGIESYLRGIALPTGMRRAHYALVSVTGRAWESKAQLLQRRYGIRVLPFWPSEDFPEVISFLTDLLERVDRGKKRNEDDSLDLIIDPRRSDRASLLKRLVVENIGPFEQLALNLHPQWNILLGDNGVGKSTILKALAVALIGRDAEPFAFRLLRVPEKSAELPLPGTITLQTEKDDYKAVLRSRSGQRVEIQSIPSRPLEAEGWLAVGFPPLRTVSWERTRAQEAIPRLRPSSDDLLPLIKGEPDPRLDKLKQWIVNLDYWIKDERLRSGNGGIYENLLNDFFRIVGGLTEGVMIEFVEVRPQSFEIVVRTDDGDIPIEGVSQGMISLMGWVGVLLQRFYEVYGNEDDPTQRYALVLMDEIDAHLHPTWQRTLVSKLGKIFPNVQFIATTHSPLVVSGMLPEQVFRFARDADGRVTRLPVDADMTVGRADQILTGDLFGLATTLDPTTEAAIGEYAGKLLGKSRRSEAEEQEFQRLRSVLHARIPVSGETPVERRAQELLQSLLRAQVGDRFSEAQEELLEMARKLFQSIQKERSV